MEPARHCMRTVGRFCRANVRWVCNFVGSSRAKAGVILSEEAWVGVKRRTPELNPGKGEELNHPRPSQPWIQFRGPSLHTHPRALAQDYT
jgi:hypothetical protein